MNLSAFDTYCLFFALRNHFTQEKYDYFKYNGKLKFSKDSFASRKDRIQFQKLSRQYNEDELKDFILANILAGKIWPVDFLMDDAHDNYMAYLKRKQSISYIFDNEMDNLLKDAKLPKDVIKIKKNEYPKIINYYLQNSISIETIAILDIFVNFSDVYDKKLGKDDVIWSKLRMLINKVKPFLQYDRDKIKQILKQKINKFKKDNTLEKT